MTEVIIPNAPDPDVVGLNSLRRQTRMFIKDNPVDLVVERPNWQDDGAGGRINTGATFLPAQEVRVVQQREGQHTERRLVGGEVVKPSLTVVCMWNADIQEGDYLEWRGNRIEVVWITDLHYVIHAEVVTR